MPEGRQTECSLATEHARLTTFLSRMRADQRPCFLALRALAMSLGPDVHEKVEGGEVTYFRRLKPFVLLRAGRSSPSVVFPDGIPIEDPTGRLLRRGEERYVLLEPGHELDAHVQGFVRKAYAESRN